MLMYNIRQFCGIMQLTLFSLLDAVHVVSMCLSPDKICNQIRWSVYSFENTHLFIIMI